MRPEHLRPVGADDLIAYPIPAAERLESHSFFAFHYRRWRNSRFRLLADLEVRAVFWELVCASQDEGPVGTLPVEDGLLAQLAGVSLDVWVRLSQRTIGPLHGWQRCLCDTGEIKLFHPVVLEVALAALKGRLGHIEKLEADRERKRLSELPARILRAGGSQRMADDAAYVLRLDQWLLETVEPGRHRTPRIVRAAMEQMDAALNAGLLAG